MTATAQRSELSERGYLLLNKPIHPLLYGASVEPSDQVVPGRHSSGPERQPKGSALGRIDLGLVRLK